MRQVERAIRTRFGGPARLRTVGQEKPFTLSVIDTEGIVLLLGQGQWRTRLTWECLESIPEFLRRENGWVPAGGVHSVAGEPGTLDEYLKRYLKRDVARWLAVVLRDAGVIELSEGPPLRVRLRKGFS